MFFTVDGFNTYYD